MQPENLYEMATTYGVRIIGVILLLVVSWLVAGWAGTLVARACERSKMDLTLGRFFARLVRYTVLILAVLTCLSVFGIQTTSFAAIIGAAGLAIGFAMQGSLSNFSSGVMLLIFRPYKVGDVVTVGGNTGKVFEIELFTTALDTFDNRRLIIPNSQIFGSTIEIITYHDTRRTDVAVGVAYTADIDQTRQVLERAVGAVQGVLSDPPSQVVLSDLGESSVNWVVRAWCKGDDFWAVKERLTREIKMSLDAAGIAIPFPQMDVHLDGGIAQHA